MLLMPDPTSAILDPGTEAPTLSLICEIADPITREGYSRDPRQVAKRAEEYLRSTGIADTCFVGPECEFFVFDEVSYDLGPNAAHYSVDSSRGLLELRQAGPRLHVAAEGGLLPDGAARLAPRPAHRDGADARAARDPVRVPPPRGRLRRPVRDRPPLPDALTRMADQVMTYKYVVKNVARAHGKSVTFMPKPIFGDNGSGMHCHQSLWKEGTPLMADKSGYAGLSQLARAYVGGLLEHAPRCSRSARRRRTRTGGSCRATRRRSTSSTRSATARPASGSRCTPTRRRRSGSSSAAPTRPRTRTSPSRRC